MSYTLDVVADNTRIAMDALDVAYENCVAICLDPVIARPAPIITELRDKAKNAAQECRSMLASIERFRDQTLITHGVK